MTRYLGVTMLVVAAAALSACGDKEKKGAAGGGETSKASTPEAPAPAAGGAKYDAAKSTASLSGVVKWAGAKQAKVMKQVSGDAFCTGAHPGGQIEDDRFTVNDDGTMPNCFVWAKDGPHKGMTGFPEPGAFTLEQKGCNYVPHVFGLMVNQKFNVKNDDQTTHNVHVKPRANKEFNKAQSAGTTDTFFFDKREAAIPFGCDIHSWMSAVCFVLDHPFFATTDASGKFEIKGLPAGDYTFVIWHESFSAAVPEYRQEFTVSVKDGESATHDVELK